MPRETRSEARTRITAELMDAARRQLADVGAAGLSLREVAREIGMVSSAVYRYVESRDELLTRLIIEAYESLGAVAEATSRRVAGQRPGDDLARWIETCASIRTWAIERPQQYLLLYGTPVPGYAAPQDTVDPGTRVTFALIGILGDAWSSGRLAPPADPPLEADAGLRDELRQLADTTLGDLDPDTVVALLAAWTQLFGLISFELTNQTRGVIADHAGLFRATTHRLGHQLGLRDGITDEVTR